MLGEILDRVAAVPKDAFVTINVGDRTLARCGVQEGRIVRHHPELIGVGLDVPQLHRP